MADNIDFSRRMVLGSAFGLGTVGALEGSAAAATLPANPSSVFSLTATGIPGGNVGGSMDVLTWSFGTTSTVNPFSTTGSGGGVGKSAPMDFVFVKRMDVASPLLHKACVTGRAIAQLKLTARRSQAPFDYLEVVLRTVFITSYVAAPSDTDAYPLDVVHAKFAKITQSFTPQNVDGATGPPVTFAFDFVNNKAF